MESNIKASFIPKDAGNLGSSAPLPSSRFASRRSSLVDVLMIFAVVLLVASVALGAGAFLYLNYVNASYKNGINTLKRTSNDTSFVTQATRTADRMSIASKLLAAHLAPTIFFDLLDNLTLKSVSFDNLKYDTTQGSDVEISMQGVAGSVNAIALQAEVLSKNPAFSSPIFTNISRQKDGVHFLLTVQVSPASLAYSTLVSGQTAAAASATGNPQAAQGQAAGTPQSAPTGTSTKSAAQIPLFTQ